MRQHQWQRRWRRPWHGLAALALVLGAAMAQAQAPERSPLPVPRPMPAPLPAQVPTTMVPQRPPTMAPGPEGAPAAIRPQPRPAQVPMNMVPVRPPTVALATGPETAPATASAGVPAGLRPEPRPALRPTPPQTPFDPTAGPAASLPPAPGERARPAVALADNGASPLAPRRSLHPPRRSPAALARFLEAGRARAQPAAAVGGGGGRAAGGLCGVPTLEGRVLSRINSATGGCGIDEPVAVTAVAGVRLSQPATLDCDTARAFDRWVRQAMLPAVGNAGGGVAQIRIAAHYTCRPRNNRAGARISEHGRGRAIDIAGFRLANGESVSILGDWRRGPHASALQQMHRAACGIFRTTLGPGSDGMHEDHLHFDMARHRNGGTYCR